MSDSKSVKMHYDVAGDDFDRAGEASAGLKRLLQKIGVPADIIRRIAIGTYEAEMNVIIHVPPFWNSLSSHYYKESRRLQTMYILST